MNIFAYSIFLKSRKNAVIKLIFCISIDHNKLKNNTSFILFLFIDKFFLFLNINLIYFLTYLFIENFINKMQKQNSA